MNRRTEQKRNKWASRQLLLGIVISSSFFFHSPIRRLCYKFFFATPKLSMSNEIYRLIVCAYNTDSCLFLCIWSWVINRERQKKIYTKENKTRFVQLCSIYWLGRPVSSGLCTKRLKSIANFGCSDFIVSSAVVSSFADVSFSLLVLLRRHRYIL